ncbi:MAG: enoyl-CoA hydratase/isomerase family protein [Alphaproteobacteria bacterium]|jgi:enoyl-CoA hydratase/carnithine racemase|nr:enoyl-CoA hydratase/isomerase family protein [Alphaproteobacteria bacterium]
MTESRTEAVTVGRDGGLATVTLNRPDKLNAFDKPMWRDLTAAVRTLAADDSVRCIMLTGAGSAFCPGADISEFSRERGSPEQAHAYGRIMDEAYDALRSCRHPLIARIRGACTGVGMIVALLCDLRISAESGRFGAPVARLGLAMPLSEFAILFEEVGKAVAVEIVLEARVFDAREAQAKGIVQRVVSEDALDEAVAETVKRLLAGAPLVHRWHKSFARRLAAGGPPTGVEIADSYQSFATADYREGIAAFLEKRRPVFRGE